MSMFGNNQRAKDDPQYSVLPGGHSPSRLLQGKKRRNLFLGLGLLVAGGLVLVWARQPHDVLPSIPSLTTETTLPPLYSDFHRAELALPQHDTHHPFAGGRKYMWVADHAQSSGWGNFMQDMIFNAELVYRTGRSYVFDNYTWDRDGGDYAEFNGKKIPSRVPLSALISGPVVGGPFSDGDRTPRAVAKEYWDEICPKSTIIRADKIRESLEPGFTAEQLMDAFQAVASEIDDPCLEVERFSGTIFHIFMFGTPREMMPSWPKISHSPIFKLFGWGKLAHEAFEMNRHLFAPHPLIDEYVTTPDCPLCVDPYAPLPGLLAVHLRRGDFLEHCENLGHWGAAFQAFNSFSTFPDPWESPEGSEDERMAVYMRRCLPTIEQIVEKIEAVRAQPTSAGLKQIYIMTNGDREWLRDLKDALWGAFEWDLIATSRDVEWTPEQKYVSQTMDMLVGQRAQVFIGNGFSSMTSSIAILRQVHELNPGSTHMW